MGSGGESGEHPSARLKSVTMVAGFLARAGLADTRPGSFSRKANPFGGPDTGIGYVPGIGANWSKPGTYGVEFGVKF